MRLRTRLFLGIGLLFFLGFVGSYYLESYFASLSLKKGEVEFKKKILTLYEARRQSLENYLHVAISDDQADLDSLLLHIARNTELGKSLFVRQENIQSDVWATSAYLLLSNPEVSFIQVHRQGGEAISLMPVEVPLKNAMRIPFGEGLDWVFLEGDRALNEPYLGVRFNVALQPGKAAGLSPEIGRLLVQEWELVALFNPAQIWNFSGAASAIESQGTIAADIKGLVAALQRAKDYLRSRVKNFAMLDGWIKREIQSKAGDGKLFVKREEAASLACADTGSQALNRDLLKIFQRRDQILMVMTLASLLPSQIFGDSPFDSRAPLGLVHFKDPKSAGETVFTKEIFFNKALFDDVNYYRMAPSKPGCSNIGSFLAVILPPVMNRVFIGNTLKIGGDKESGYLTLGVDGDALLLDLVLSLNESALLVHQGKIVSAMLQNGTRITNPSAFIPLGPDMLKSSNGIFNWQGESYYYLHMMPFQNLDLHFYVMTPEKEAFALAQSIEEGSRQVIQRVSLTMRIVALGALVATLIVLHRIARRISEPITQLADVTKDIAKGKLEGLQLPKYASRRKDEVALLCEGFEKMVQDLKEKEKVKGVLNKVVSKEIAQEIMRGNVHLGGEEKLVTVLFADIRSFTKISNAMAPHEVIEMLNQCMTKVSHLIDEFGGVIDKYVGDEVMALFGAPIAKEDSGLRAVECALKIVEELKNWNEERLKKGLPRVEMGVGIHTGIVLVGNMGAENRLNYTVIGTVVNLAARLCSAAKPLQILITQDTLNQPQVKEKIHVKTIEPIEFKGFSEKIAVFEVEHL